MRSKNIFYVLVSLLFFSILSSCQKMDGRKMIMRGAADPFILKSSDGFYYLYATSLDYGFKAWKSKDKENWTEVGIVLDGRDSWGYQHFWAPEVYEIDRHYYMIYSARWKENNSLRIGIAQSEKPSGPFIPISDKPLFDFGYAVIDGHLFFEDNKIYLYYSRDCSENTINGIGESHIYGVELSSDIKTLLGEPKLLLKPEQEWEKIMFDNKLWNEGPFMLKKNNIYYLTYSANFYGGSDYSVGYATSDNPLGDYKKYSNNPILKSDIRNKFSGPGHHALLQENNKIYIVYHAHHNHIVQGGDRDAYIDLLKINRDGTLSIENITN